MRSNYTTLLFTITLLGFGLVSAGCKKKISRYPFAMEGMWYSPDAFSCGGPVLVIGKDGSGRFLGHSGECDTRTPDKSGEVKYKKNVLFVGDKSFSIIEKPELVNQADSIIAPYAEDLAGKTLKKYPILAKMTIQERKVLTEEGKYVFYKYLDY